MKKALAVILAVLAHLSPNRRRFCDGCRPGLFPTRLTTPFRRCMRSSPLPLFSACSTAGALLLMLSAKMPLAVSVIGFFLSFFYVAFFFFGYFYTPIRIFHPRRALRDGLHVHPLLARPAGPVGLGP